MKLPQNMHWVDRVIRLIVAIVIAILYFTGMITGTLAIILGIIAVLAILTSASGLCPIYYMLGISSKDMGKK